MAKSGKHKRERKKEKAKIQLKGSIKLLKAQNIVNVNLKSKKILIRKQLANPLEDEASTKRKQTLDDILSSLNHHNVNIKKQALDGLLELALSSDAFLFTNLERIIQKISSINSDTEDIIRKENLKIAGVIFGKITENQLEPFWTTVLNYVNCSLNNLSSKVRFGTLSFISLLSIHFPNLVSRSLNIILPSILSLITSQTDPSRKGTLKIEIFDKQSDSLKHRIRVLNVISNCLELELRKENDEFIKIPTDNDLNQNSTKSSNILYTFSYGINDNMKCESSRSSQEKILDLTGNFWSKFLQDCLPILFEIWMEVGPNCEARDNALPSSNLNDEKVNILHCIVNVIIYLIKKNKMEILKVSKEDRFSLIENLKKQSSKDFTRNFLNWLPYSNIRESHRLEIVSINLKFFYISAYFHLFDSDLTKRFEEYIKKLMDRSYVLKNEQIQTLFEILSISHQQISGSISTKFILSTLKLKEHKNITLRFFSNSLNIEKVKNDNQIIKMEGWNIIIPQLLIICCNNKDIDFELLSFLSLISLHQLTNLKPLLEKYLQFFKEFLEDNMCLNIWDKTLQLFYYSNTLNLLNNINMPSELKESFKILLELNY